MNVLALWHLLAGALWQDSESVSTEVVTLSLQQVSWQSLGSVTVVEGQSGREGWSWDTLGGSQSNSLSPARLSLGDSLSEELVEQQVLQLRVLSVGLGDFSQEDRSDDTATSPHQSDGRVVELPVVSLTGFTDQHETLGVRDNLGSVQGLLQVVNELLLVLDGVLGHLWAW